MDWTEVIENLKYLISDGCTDTQFDYADEIEIAIRVMESQEDLRSKINKAIKQITDSMNEHLSSDGTPIDEYAYCYLNALEILEENIGE